ncbi:MAG TPA: valine--tRNA ligase [Candidatus Limiplasma sp.]|nr:valine--tRNA ligase [Candidatus Limiplasma sp.]HPS81713.1 valine--tRNA ligase [Candidatus Limiplasma sp.]
MSETPKEFEMDKVYNPKEIEDRLYQMWEDSGAFVAKRVEGKKPYTIVMPPPNITGQLHMGHAMDCLLQDAPIRYHRMKGDPTLWLPGTDHASIATEVKIVEQMKKEGLTKEQIGREAFLERAWEWKAEYGGRINRQQRRLGASCDWSRERFTMDEGCNEAVREVFVNLYQKGLIYRGNRIINWCPVCKTALSDAEVEYEEQHSHLWHIHYPAVDGGKGVTVATTRPETMLGDTAVAVNPNDERYRDLVGKMVMLPIVNKPIPVVADDYVDMAFGTGAVKITPAHDPNDFEVAMRHHLEIIRVTNDDGTMNANAGKYEGVHEYECRKLIVKELEAQGYLVKAEDYTHNVGTCYRCHTTVDPVTSLQWFVKMEPLAKPAIEVVRNGETKFLPERFAKVYFNWMENIRDWCISRQLWWGHRIPAWYCADCGEMTVAKSAPETCPKCGGTHLRQDEDVLDTWFSSALWPFSTLGWPHQTEDLKYFYPTNMLVTGYDIIFFWVARMIFSGIEQMGQTPFDTVLIHGLVRDAQGRKMSKSLGNGVDPLEVIDSYGADALRFSLAMGISPGNDTRFSTEKVEAARNFANKVWNASRFVLMNMQTHETIDPAQLTLPDQWILSRLQKTVAEVSDHMEDGDFGLSANRIYEFTWNEFCDWYIELSKSRLTGEDEAAKRNVRAVLYTVLENLLKLLHPFMPYLTEEVYQHLPEAQGMLILAKWPEVNNAFTFEKEEAKMEGLMEVIRTIRNLRAEMKVQPSKRTHVTLLPEAGWEDAMAGAEPYLQRLAGASTVTVGKKGDLSAEKTVSAVCASAEIRIPLGELVDFEKEIARLEKERAALENEITRAQARLNNPGFTGKAPPALVEQEQQKLATNQGMLTSLEQRIAELKANA